MSPQNVYVEVLTPNMTIFEDGDFGEITEIKQGCKGGTLI